MKVIQDKNYYREYRLKNLDRIREKNKAWYSRTKEARHAYHKDFYIKHRERLLEISRNNHIKFREKISENHRNNSISRRKLILAILGDKCVRCGYDSDYRALQIDHVNGNGYLEIKKMSHSWSFKFWINALRERRSEYQLLCANCNWIKRIENKEIWNSKKCQISA